MTATGRQRGRHRRRRARISAAGTLTCALALLGGAPATAAQSASLSAAFTPERLGQPTAVSFAFTIRTPGGGVPPALSAVQIRYPAGLGIATSGLGVASCQPSRLEQSGPDGCPADSRMGSGQAQLRFAIGPQVFQEDASLALIAGPSPDGYVHMLIAATGTQPVAARVVMATLLNEGALNITVPAVASLPEGPDVAIVSVHATLGGPLTYYEHTRGRTIAYHPGGIVLPARCPRGGFAFSATFTFADAGHASAATTVRCPRRS